MKYDVFLSYKSEDYKIAKKVNHFLRESGLTVFFSEVTLKNIGKAEYSVSIDKAIDSCNHMIVVASKVEYLTQGWVQYEWSSFADNIKCGYKSGNLLTILTPDINLHELPLGLRHRQAFSTRNFDENILPYLMLAELTNTQSKSRPKVKKSTIAVTATAILIIGLCGYFLRNYNKAVYPENTPSFIYDFRDSSIISSLLANERFDIDSNKVASYYQLALDGGSEAQFEIGTYCYEMSWYEQALHWYILSAKQGNAKAANGIGRCFYNGYGTAKWPRNAYNWFRHSADGNSADGMNNLGKCLVEGTGVIARNKKRALKYYKKAAELKCVPAEYNIGIHLFFGNGIEQRIEDGLYWLNKAANEGSASAQYSLGTIYREGLEGINIDLDLAESWYLKAINNCDAVIAAKAMEGMKLLRRDVMQR